MKIHFWQCLNLIKKDTGDYTTFASVRNREYEKFKLSELTPDMFKCLIFVQVLTAPKDANIKSRLLSKLEQDSKMTLQNITEECQPIINLRHGTAKTEEKKYFVHTHRGKKEHGKKKEGFLLKLILDLDADKYAYIKITLLKIKSVIITEKNSEKIRNSKIRLTLQKQKTHLLR